MWYVRMQGGLAMIAAMMPAIMAPIVAAGVCCGVCVMCLMRVAC
jgi:hypothetical protein